MDKDKDCRSENRQGLDIYLEMSCEKLIAYIQEIELRGDYFSKSQHLKIASDNLARLYTVRDSLAKLA